MVLTRYAITVFLVMSACILAPAQTDQPLGPWKGYAILGNGDMTVVYSDDPRIAQSTHAHGIQHLYFRDYTADYISSTEFRLTDEESGSERVGMKNFFTAQTRRQETTLDCFVHPDGAAVLAFAASGLHGDAAYNFTAVLRGKPDSVKIQDGMALAAWPNGVVLAVLSASGNARLAVSGSSVSATGHLSRNGNRADFLIIPAASKTEALAKARAFQHKSDLEADAATRWNAWMNSGKLPQDATYLEAYKRNLYCVKSANLHGQIPADVTGQFVTNGMPQLYPRDAMMCARALLATGHKAEAKEVIEFWANSAIPMKSSGEWYARYDAHARAVDAGTGARFDEPEWDSNGYFIYLVNRYHAETGVWLADAQLIYELADFLVSHLSPNGLLWEGGIVEWTGYLPATNMIDAAALKTASQMARAFGDVNRAERYKSAAERIASSMPYMFDKARETYADVRFTGQKTDGGVSSNQQSGSKLYLWDTTANVGVIWGYPNDLAMQVTNVFYDDNTVKLGGGMQYFDSPDPGLASYGHGVFFFTTAAAAEYQTMYGSKRVAGGFLDWMLRNANSYGLMPEHISPDGREVSPASPLSWCSAEFAAAVLLWAGLLN